MTVLMAWNILVAMWFSFALVWFQSFVSSKFQLMFHFFIFCIIIFTTEDVEFSHEATMLLIKCIRKRYAELISNNRARPQIYKDIHAELTMRGYNFSVERIRRKWNNLLGTYKRVKKEYSPRNPPWEYYQVFILFSYFFSLYDWLLSFKYFKKSFHILKCLICP